jgi:hypothetical protein
MEPSKQIEAIKETINLKNVLSIILRYVVLILLYIIIFYFFKKENIQFLLFILFFITLFFTIVFLLRDIFTLNSVVNAFYNPLTSFDFTDENSSYIKLFMIILVCCLLLLFSSTAIILAVFDYGKSSLIDYNSHKLTFPNILIMDEYKEYLKYSVLIIGFLSYSIVLNYASPKVKTLLFNITSILLCVLILYNTIYNIILAAKFLENKKYNRQLYE